MWNKGQVIVALSRTNIGNNVFVGQKQDITCTCRAYSYEHPMDGLYLRIFSSNIL